MHDNDPDDVVFSKEEASRHVSLTVSTASAAEECDIADAGRRGSYNRSGSLAVPQNASTPQRSILENSMLSTADLPSSSVA